MTINKMVRYKVVFKKRVIFSDWENLREVHSPELELSINKLENNEKEYSVYKKQNGKSPEVRETYFQREKRERYLKELHDGLQHCRGWQVHICRVCLQSGVRIPSSLGDLSPFLSTY